MAESVYKVVELIGTSTGVMGKSSDGSCRKSWAKPQGLADSRGD